MTAIKIGDRYFRPFGADPEPRQLTDPERLRQWILSRYDTHVEAADELGVSRAVISNYVCGKRRIPDWLRKEAGLE